MSYNVTDKLIDDIIYLMNSDIPEHVILEAKMSLIDYLGVTLAGAELLRDKGTILLRNTGSGKQSGASVIGFDVKTSSQMAALLNGMCAHVAELDDGERFGMIHPGATVISALLPLAEIEGFSGSNLILGIIAGYEATLRIAAALQPSMKKKGYHATGVCGTIGAAFGSAVALQFPKKIIKAAVSAAAASASGMLKATRDASELKPYNAGQAASNGLLSALVARAGFQCPDDIFSGEDGFLHLYSDDVDMSRLFSKSGAPFRIEKTYKKPYASCRHCHSAIDAALKIRSESGITAENIKKIEIATYELAIKGHDHTDISSVSSAKMSIPYSVAVALFSGKVGLQEFVTDRIKDKRVLALTENVQINSDEELSRLCPQKRAAIVKVIANDGRCWEKRVDYPKGEPENPLSIQDIEHKFTGLAMYGGKSEKETAMILKSAWSIESKLKELYDRIRRL